MSMNRLSHLVLASAAALLCSHCGSDPEPAAAVAKPAAGLVVTGTLTTSLDGKGVVIDYSGQKAGATIVHKLNKDPKGFACVVQFDLTLAKPDGTCQLDLQFALNNGNMALTKGRFHAVGADIQDGIVIQTHPCAEWPETAKGELIYEGSSADATVSMKPLGQPEAGQDKATLSNLVLTMSGSVEMKSKGKKFSFDLKHLSFKGSAESTGRSDVSCGSAVAATGIAQCPAKVNYGPAVGDYLRRGKMVYRCDDDEPFDLGELCGYSAIWVTDYRDWPEVKAGVDSHRAVYDQFKDQHIGAAFIVVEGSQKVVVEKPGEPGKFEASGPAPNKEACVAIGVKYNLHPDVVLLYDKDKSLVSQDSELAAVKFVPRMVFAKGNGQIVTMLPGDEGKAPSSTDISAALTAALEAP